MLLLLLLLHGIICSTSFAILFESHNDRTFLFILFASFIAFLSTHGSQTTTSSGSIKLLRFKLVSMPAGYFFVNAFMPVSSEKRLTAFHPAILLHTTRTSSGLNFARKSIDSLNFLSIRFVLRTASPSALLLYTYLLITGVITFVPR